MFHWSAYPFLRIAVAWICGILLGTGLNSGREILFALVLFAGLAAVLLFSLTRKSRFYRWNPALGIVILSGIMIAGAYHSFQNNAQNDPDHLLYAKPFSWYAGEICDATEKTNRFDKVPVRISHIRTEQGWKKATGTALVYFPEGLGFRYGDHVVVRGVPNKIAPPLNPNEFDYQKYLARQNIFHSHFVRSKDDVLLTERNGGYSVYAWILELRQAAAGLIQKYINGQQEQAVALALILGIKNELDNDLTKAYGGSGAMHVLAVSGLHVGIVYGFLFALFGRIRRFRTAE